jgi:hypothetical protein
MRGQVELGVDSVAQLRKAEAEMKAQRQNRIAEGLAARSAEFAKMQIADSDAFASYAARCDALGDALPAVELAREREAIVRDAQAGNRAAAAARVRQLERRADLEQATTVSQRLVTEQILKRAGDFVLKAKEGNNVRGNLDLGNGIGMPMQIVSLPPSEEGGPTVHEVVFESAKSPLESCSEQHEAVRDIARAAGSELRLDDPGDESPEEASRRRKRKKRAKQAKANKTRRAG